MALEILEPITIVYLIRHAQSIDDEQNLSQRPDSKLSAKGIEQAEKLAERFPYRTCDKVFCSTYARSIETGKIFVEKLGLPESVIEIISDIDERRKPVSIMGLNRLTPEFDSTRAKLFDAIANNERFEDMETNDEMASRVLAAMNRFEYMQDKKIAVISHGHFLKMFLFKVLFGKDSDISIFPHMDAVFKFKNTSLLRCIYKHDSKIWKVYIDQIK